LLFGLGGCCCFLATLCCRGCSLGRFPAALCAALCSLCPLHGLGRGCRCLFGNNRCCNNLLTDKLRCRNNLAADLDRAEFKMRGTRELVAAMAEGVLDLLKVLRGREDRHDLLAGFDPCGGTDRLAEREAHAFRDPVCTGPGRLLVLTQDVVGEDTDLEMEVRPADFLEQAAVYRDAGGFQCAVPDLARLFN